MAFIPTVDTVRCALNFTIGSQNGVNTLWFKKSSSIVSADLAIIATDLVSWWDTYGDPCVVPACTLNSIDVVDQNTSSSPSLSHLISPAIAGTATGYAAPLNSTVVVSHRTLNRGRSSRGRFYLYGMSEADTNNDGVTLTSALQGLLAVLFANLNSFVSPDGFSHVVVSKQLDKVTRSAGYAQAVTSYIIDLALDSQRRRLQGRGI